MFGQLLSSTPAPAPRALRPFRMDTILGSPGMGKTSLADEWIQAWMKERVGRGVLRCLDPVRQFRHYGATASWPGEDNPDDDRTPEARAEAWIKALAKERLGKTDAPPCLAVLDDADVFLSSGSPRGMWRHFFMTFRHWRCDVIAIGRRSQELPKVLFQNSSAIALFATNEPGSLQYLRELISPKIISDIPQKPHRYLLVDMQTKTGKLHSTRQRAVTVAADRQ